MLTVCGVTGGGVWSIENWRVSGCSVAAWFRGWPGCMYTLVYIVVYEHVYLHIYIFFVIPKGGS